MAKNELGNSNIVNDGQLQRHSLSSEVTDAGRQTDARLAHPKKAQHST
jgi:hypothetical protein